MKYFFLWLCFSLFFISCSSDNKLTSKEKSEGWVLLFNGKDFAGWRQCNGESMPSNWIIEDGAMKVLTGEGKKSRSKVLKGILSSKIKNLKTLNYR